MAVLWGVILVAVFGGTSANIFTTPTDTPLTKLYVIHWFITYYFPLLVVAGVLLLLTVVSWIGSRERKASSFLSPDQQSRVIILKSLRKAYTDELGASLQGMARIALGLHERFDLTHPARLSPWLPSQLERILPDGTTIVDAYDQAGNGLLILGEPGVGKSTLLYDLAQALLSQAEQDEQHLLPVILNLSSWATRRLPLEKWLVEELQRRYLIPRQQSQRWVQQTKLLLLLDGLDEVAASARGACIKAINTYQSEHLVPLVVCSRREEYQAMSEQFTLQSAVIVQPLSSEQVKDYLAKAGEALAAVQTAMNTNPVLQELLTTPLMLSVVTLTYKDKAVKDLPQFGSPEEQQRQVFERYITQALEKKRERPWYYASQPTRKWLSLLAQQMQQRGLTEFYLEYLDLSWLSTRRAQVLSHWFGGLVVGLGCGLFGGLIGGLVGGLVSELVFRLLGGGQVSEPHSGGLFGGLVGGLGCGLFVGLIGGLVGWVSGTPPNKYEEPKQTIRYPGWGGWEVIRWGLLFGLVVWLVTGLIGGLIGGLLSGLVNGLVGGLIGGLIFGLIFGLPVGLIGGMAYLAHYSVRSILWRSGAIPWHYVRFLEEARERILLQRVGGGYRFIHPLFLDYFASGAVLSPPVVEPLPTQQL